jgi:hypothetical protein
MERKGTHPIVDVSAEFDGLQKQKKQANRKKRNELHLPTKKLGSSHMLCLKRQQQTIEGKE